MTALLEKADRAILDDQNVRNILDRVRQDPLNGIPALEISLMELALWDLHRNRETLKKHSKELRDQDITKFSRALVKTFMKSHPDSEMAQRYARQYFQKAEGDRFITITEYKRQDGTLVPEHRRRLPTGHSASDKQESKEIENELKEAAKYQQREGASEKEKGKLANALQRFVDVRGEAEQEEERQTRLDEGADAARGDMRRSERAALDIGDIGDLDFSMRTRAEDFADRIREIDPSLEVFTPSDPNKISPKDMDASANRDQIIGGALKTALESSGIGQGILNVAEFLGRTTNTVAFAARAIKEYGPMVGVRMAHAYFRYGGYDMPITLHPDGGYQTELGDTLPPIGDRERTRQWAMQVLESRLPSDEARKGQAEPPSEGFIIDRDGQVIAHGTGRGNDHFLPFSMRHLRKMREERGVEYIRRRMFGGPTTEDLHVAMMMGADKLTVVSRQGVYSVDLSPRSHGLKMEHTQILSRFHDLMDNRKHRRRKDYTEVLEALDAEFPLHFRVDRQLSSIEGPWAQIDDRIAPKSSFIDQMRKLFGVETAADRRHRQQEEQVNQLARTRPPWREANLSMRDWISVRSHDLGGDRARAIREAMRFAENSETRSRLARDLDKAIDTQRGVYQPTMSEQARDRADDRSARVAQATGASGREGWNPVVTSQATPVDYQRFQRASEVLEEEGVDLGDISMSAYQNAVPYLESIENSTDDQLEMMRESGEIAEFLEDIMGSGR